MRRHKEIYALQNVNFILLKYPEERCIIMFSKRALRVNPEVTAMSQNVFLPIVFLSCGRNLLSSALSVARCTSLKNFFTGMKFFFTGKSPLCALRCSQPLLSSPLRTKERCPLWMFTKCSCDRTYIYSLTDGNTQCFCQCTFCALNCFSQRNVAFG